jgi:hypothetical protein
MGEIRSMHEETRNALGNFTGQGNLQHIGGI